MTTTTAQAYGLLLPIHETFYGEIEPAELSNFLACAGEALRTVGLTRIKTLHEETASEQEMWGIGPLTTEGVPMCVVTLEGVDAELEIDWLSLIEADTDEIVEALNAAIAQFCNA